MKKERFYQITDYYTKEKTYIPENALSKCGGK